MKVYFIGAGPGAPDLITVRGARLLSGAAMVLLADSLVTRELVMEHCRPDVQIIEVATLDFGQQEECYRVARNHDCNVVRLHSGDPSVYGATTEQMDLLDRLGIDYEVVPGVSSITAAAAILKTELLRPSGWHPLTISRTGDGEEVTSGEGGARVILLGGPHLERLVGELAQRYPQETPIALVKNASRPGETTWRGTLGTVLAANETGHWAVATLMLVGEAAEPRRR